MRSVLARWRKSDLSLKAFAEESGVRYWKLTYWKKRLAAKSEVPELLPVRLVDATAAITEVPAVDFEISVMSGRRILVRSGFDVDELRRLIVAVESC